MIHKKLLARPSPRRTSFEVRTCGGAKGHSGLHMPDNHPLWMIIIKNHQLLSIMFGASILVFSVSSKGND